MVLKRSREDYQHHDHQVETTLAMANYLLMLSQGFKTSVAPEKERVFECKTCNRKFPSFQALGGHRASHKRPRSSSNVDDHDDHSIGSTEETGVRPKVHECSICGSTFSIGQALGGHMRRHRAQLSGFPLPSSSYDHLGMRRNNGGLSLDLNLTPQENGLLDMKNISPIFA